MKCVTKNCQLRNRYWLKVVFCMVTKQEWNYHPNTWTVEIAVAKTRRKVNDHFRKSRDSPKRHYNESTNSKGGIESLVKALNILQDFEKTLPTGSNIIVEGTDDQRILVYSRLQRYGYKRTKWFAPGEYWHGQVYYFKKIE